MGLPTIEGVIRRRVLVNFAAEPEVVARLLPAPLAPKLVGGKAIVGVCLIRLERIRPRHVPAALGIASENAAHRIAVTFGDGREGVYIPRRDTSSLVNALAGGRLFPGEHHRADFDVTDEDGTIDLSMRARDGSAAVSLRAHATDTLSSRLFGSLDEASAFFRGGALGYSARSEPRGPRLFGKYSSRIRGDQNQQTLDGITLHTDAWGVAPLAVERMTSTWFEDTSRFPAGSLDFDCALVMRDIPHEWREEPELRTA